MYVINSAMFQIRVADKVPPQMAWMNTRHQVNFIAFHYFNTSMINGLKFQNFSPYFFFFFFFLLNLAFLCHSLINCLVEWQTVYALIRLLLQDLSLHCADTSLSETLVHKS